MTEHDVCGNQLNFGLSSISMPKSDIGYNKPTDPSIASDQNDNGLQFWTCGNQFEH